MDLAISAICMHWLSHYTPLPRSFLVGFFARQARDFVFGAGAGKARHHRLPAILHDISPSSDKYLNFERLMAKEAARQNARPEDLHDLSEWPDFRW